MHWPIIETTFGLRSRRRSSAMILVSRSDYPHARWFYHRPYFSSENRYRPGGGICARLQKRTSLLGIKRKPMGTPVPANSVEKVIFGRTTKFFRAAERLSDHIDLYNRGHEPDFLFIKNRAAQERSNNRPSRDFEATRGSGLDQKSAFDNTRAIAGCPDRRIDRLCMTCCSPSQLSHHAGCPARPRLRRKRDSSLLAIQGPGHPRNLVSKGNGDSLT